MTGSLEPKKETMRIIVSPAHTAPATGRETLQVLLPPRPPTGHSPAPNGPSPIQVTAAAIPKPVAAHAPKQETSCIAVLPDSPVKPAAEMKEDQSLPDLPTVGTPVSKVTIAPQMQIDDIPTSLYWAVLATSAAILILQIWNYLS